MLSDFLLKSYASSCLQSRRTMGVKIFGGREMLVRNLEVLDAGVLRKNYLVATQGAQGSFLG